MNAEPLSDEAQDVAFLKRSLLAALELSAQRDARITALQSLVLEAERTVDARDKVAKEMVMEAVIALRTPQIPGLIGPMDWGRWVYDFVQRYKYLLDDKGATDGKQ